jgi:hypothetical protein
MFFRESALSFFQSKVITLKKYSYKKKQLQNLKSEWFKDNSTFLTALGNKEITMAQYVAR